MSKIRQPGDGFIMTQKLIFHELWNRLPRKSFISGLFLRDFANTELFYSCFAHVLAKGLNKYPYFLLYAKNIVLLTPQEHHFLDHGTADQRIKYSLGLEEMTGGKQKADWAKLEALAEELKKEYNENFQTTKGLIIGYKYSPEEVFEVIGRLNKKYFESLS
jgi:hypothetical protein